MSRPNQKHIVLRPAFCLAFIFICGGATAAFAGGFLDPYQSAGAASVSNAGETAIAEDAATVFYNPAGMTLLPRAEGVLASALVIPSARFSNRGSVDAIGDPMQGSDRTNPQTFSPPSLFVTAPVTDRLNIGLGIFIPFGQSSKYDDDWVGRYQVQTVSLKTVDIDPAVAYRVADWLSIGGGLDVQYARLVRANALDFGSLCFIEIGPGTCPGIGLTPQHVDGRLLADVDDWGVGYNLGVLVQPIDGMHVGLSYRSKVDYTLSGTARFNVPPTAVPLTAGGALFRNTSARASLTVPDILAFGVSQRIDDRWTALFNVDWTFWDRLKRLTLTFGNPLQPALSQPLNWRDSARVAIGGLYQLSEDIELRAGVAFDQSPISDQFRTADLPDSDQVAISAGVEYRVTKSLLMTMSYTHQQSKEAALHVTVPAAGTLAGTIHRHSDAFGFQTRLQF